MSTLNFVYLTLIMIKITLKKLNVITITYKYAA